MLDSKYSGKLGLFIKSSKDIVLIYNELMNLEISGKKNTREYMEALYKLQLCIKNENQMYKMECSSSDEAIIFLDELNKYITDKTSYTDYIINSNIDNNYYTRIGNKLINLFRNHSTFAEKVMDYFTCDILNVFLYLVENYQYINDDVKNNLIKAKYNISYINTFMEDILVNKKFEVADDVYLGHLYFIRKNNANVDIDFNQILINEIEGILNINNLDYRNNSKIFSSIIHECFINSILFVDGNSNLDGLYEPSEDNTISSNILKNCRTNSDTIKNKIKILIDIKGI